MASRIQGLVWLGLGLSFIKAAAGSDNTTSEDWTKGSDDNSATNATSDLIEPATNTSLSGTTIFLSFAALAANAIQQRSGADEFLSVAALSLARISPLICTADALVAITTIFYGLNRNLGFNGSCTLYVRNRRRHLEEPYPKLNTARLFVDSATFGLALYSAVTLFRAEGLDIRITIWAAMYMGAPVISGMLRLVSENVKAQEAVTDLVYEGHGVQLLRISDVIWCIAYLGQFTLWIQVFDAFSTLPRFADGNRKWFDLAMGASISVAIALSFFCRCRFYKYWCLRRWRQKQWSVALNVGFVLVLLVGMPTDAESLAKWRQSLFVPLAAFSVVVNMLWTVTILESLFTTLLSSLQQGFSLTLMPTVRDDIITAEFKDRLNPLLSTAPQYWRQPLMLNFSFCQIFFAALNFMLIHDDNTTFAPS